MSGNHTEQSLREDVLKVGSKLTKNLFNTTSQLIVTSRPIPIYMRRHVTTCLMKFAEIEQNVAY